jgi:hypothetical protein
VKRRHKKNIFTQLPTTNDYIFTDIPQVELLQWLARASLKQNLSRSIRLWVWLRSLYEKDQECIELKDGFTLADCGMLSLLLPIPKVKRHLWVHPK